uniref:Uncharacterized protein n=1 Tax=Romanomermis culicivorax TaxID=13658 RepID=A0A915KPI7_ROMCU
MNFIRLIQNIKDDKSAVNFLQLRGILHQNRLCANGHDMTLSVSEQLRWRCRLRQCNQEKGIRGVLREK